VAGISRRRQPPERRTHPNAMRVLIPIAAVSLMLGVFSACSPNQTPDQIRQETARDTATLKQDTKAVAEGVKEGLNGKRSDEAKVDLNRASKNDLSSLPGISPEKAERIMAERPYASPHQLVTRHVLSEDEYGQIQDRIVVTH
jgi:DNA uptake protein ComE-like DNA-binding protein